MFLTVEVIMIKRIIKFLLPNMLIKHLRQCMDYYYFHPIRLKSACKPIMRRIHPIQDQRLRDMRHRRVRIVFSEFTLANGLLLYLCKHFLQDDRYQVILEGGAQERYLLDTGRAIRVDSLDWNGLSEVKPDIVFVTCGPGDFLRELIEAMSFEEMPLICLVNYSTTTSQGEWWWGMTNRDIGKLGFPDYVFAYYWRIFIDNRYAYEEFLRKGVIWKNMAVLSGSPRLNNYIEPIEEPEDYWPRTRDSGIKRIMWSPRHAVTTEELKYEAHAIVSLLKNHENLDVAFRPHPYVINPEFSKVDRCFLEDLLRELNAMEHLRIDCKATFNLGHILPGKGIENYHKAFRTSDCLICGGESFLAEYLPSMKPILYVKPDQKWENRFGKVVTNSLYQARTSDEIKEFVEQVLLKGNDPKHDDRQRVVEREILFNGNDVSGYIKEYIDGQIWSRNTNS